MSNHTLQGKVVVVGAGAKNLGALISRELAEGGAHVVVHYNSDATRRDAEATVKAVKDLGSDAYATQKERTLVSSFPLLDSAAPDGNGNDKPAPVPAASLDKLLGGK